MPPYRCAEWPPSGGAGPALRSARHICLIALRDDPGVSFGAREETMGLRGLPICEIRFDACRLPADRLLGAPGGAMAVLGATGLVTVLGAAAAALGVAEAAFAATREHLQTRTILGQPLAANPAVQAAAVRIASDLDGAHARLAHGLAVMQSGVQGPPVALWLTKIAVTEAAADITLRCQKLFGAVGYSSALPIERHVRDVIPFGIHWGNNDALMDMAGKMLFAPPPG